MNFHVLILFIFSWCGLIEQLVEGNALRYKKAEHDGDKLKINIRIWNRLIYSLLRRKEINEMKPGLIREILC